MTSKDILSHLQFQIGRMKSLTSTWKGRFASESIFKPTIGPTFNVLVQFRMRSKCAYCRIWMNWLCEPCGGMYQCLKTCSYKGSHPKHGEVPHFIPFIYRQGVHLHLIYVYTCENPHFNGRGYLPSFIEFFHPISS